MNPLRLVETALLPVFFSLLILADREKKSRPYLFLFLKNVSMIENVMRERREEKLFQGRWLSIKRASYQTRSGQLVDWEVVERAKDERVIVLLARLIPSGRHILLKQFRAGINRPVIALPAGVVGPGEDIRRQAERELKEETGYTGAIVEVSPTLKINPAILDCDLNVFRMEVDEADPLNRHPRQELEPEEEIEVILKRPEEIKDFLIGEREKGTAVDASCWLSFCAAKTQAFSRYLP